MIPSLILGVTGNGDSSGLESRRSLSEPRASGGREAGQFGKECSMSELARTRSCSCSVTCRGGCVLNVCQGAAEHIGGHDVGELDGSETVPGGSEGL